MKVLLLENPGKIFLTEMPSPSNPGQGEALVRVHRVGICGTDYHAYRGRQPFFSYPRILGHELAVDIVQLGPETAERGLRVGDRCAVEPYLNCGQCIACRHNKPNCCTDLKVLGVHVDGGMRELLTVPVRKLHRSEKLSLDQLALVETLGIGAHAVARTQLQPHENALVIGAGPIGLSVIQFARAEQTRVIVLDVNRARLEFCRDRLSVPDAVTAGADALSMVKELTGGDLPTVVFDATGNRESMMRSFEYVAAGGRLTFVGLFQGDLAFSDPEFHRRELTLRASRNSTPEDFRRVLALVETGKIDTAPWITHRTAFDMVPHQFPSLLDPSACVLKAMVCL